MSKKGIEFDLTVLAEDSELEENLTAMLPDVVFEIHSCGIISRSIHMREFLVCTNCIILQSSDRFLLQIRGNTQKSWS